MVTYKSKTKLLKYAVELYQLNNMQKAKIVAKSATANLFKLPFVFSVVRFFAKSAFEDILITELTKNEKQLNSMFDALVQHMLFGHDKTDTESAGGFNRAEFEAFAFIVIRCE